MTFFLIRHKATGEFMPQARRNRGYSHWNPGNKQCHMDEALPTPRLFTTRRHAQNAIVGWNSYPNSSVRYWEDGVEDFKIKDDGRSKDDLEVVEVVFVEM